MIIEKREEEEEEREKRKKKLQIDSLLTRAEFLTNTSILLEN